MLLILVGCLFLWIGYGFGLHAWKPLRFVRSLTKSEPGLALVMVFYAIIVLLQVIQIRVTGIAYGADAARWGILAPFRQWIGYVQDLYLVVLAIVALKAFRREWPLWPLLVVVAVQAGFGLISGFMKPILWLTVILLLAAVVAHLNLRRLVVPSVDSCNPGDLNRASRREYSS